MKPKLSNSASFLDIKIEEMFNSVTVGESILKSFKAKQRCYWALESNMDLVLEMHLTIEIAKSIYIAAKTNDKIRTEYNDFRNLAIKTLDSYPTMSKRQRVNVKTEFYTLANCSDSVRDIINNLFDVYSNCWAFKIPLYLVTNNYYNFKNPESSYTPLVVDDFKQLLRIIIRSQNCLTFIYPKRIKELRSHHLSNIKNVLQSITRELLKLPKVLEPVLVATDGVGFDIYTNNVKRNEHKWQSELNDSSRIGDVPLRVFAIQNDSGKIIYKEIYNRRKVNSITANMPKHSEFKACELLIKNQDISKEAAKKELDDKLRELFSKLG